MSVSRMTLLTVAMAVLSSGCESRGVDATPSAVETLEAQTYGELRQTAAELVPLAKVATDPDRYEGRLVRTEGKIERVCQKKGCWLELADGDGTRAFVPMAGHAFAVPVDGIGKSALVEGVVHQRERSEAERQHLQSDGAGSSIPTLSIEANAVVIRP